MSAKLLASPEEWYREGRGLTAEVEGLTVNAVQAAINSLPTAWAPYEILSVEKLSCEGKYADVTRIADAARLDECAAEGHSLYFIWSPALTPELIEPLEFEYVDRRGSSILSLNGLVSMQYRRRFRGREEPTYIGCVPKIRSYKGEFVHHSEYEKLYRSLVRHLRKAGD